MLRRRDLPRSSAFVSAAIVPARHREADIGGRLIAVSNRVSRPAAGSTPGGLALALGEALNARGGLWIGWSGDLAERDGHPPELDLSEVNGVSYGLLDLEPKAYKGFYEGYANGLLWPVFHNRPDLAEHRAADFESYRTVNRDYAHAVANSALPGDTVWVHDYHFLLLAEELRRADVAGTIGLFLHIPFPHPQTFRTVPEAETLARALMRFDVIGVQTWRDADNLCETLAGICEGTVSEAGAKLEVRAGGESLTVVPRPIGIDVSAIRAQRDSPASPEVRRYRESVKGRFSLVGVDRLDYSKGLPQKLQAFYTYLRNDPARAADTLLTQIAPVSRGNVPAYAATREELEAVAGRICGQFGTLGGSPLRLLTRGYDRRTVAQMMAVSNAALVTPLADGMNLVAKEFVTVQDADDPGVLILSEFAGAAEAMTDALLVNPHDTEGLAAAIETARTMALPARRERHAALMKVVEDTAIDRWADRCMKDLASV